MRDNVAHDSVREPSEPMVKWLDSIPELPKRDGASHKGNFGRALLIGGSRGMAGAIALAGMAALRGGAGLVRLAVPAPCLDTVAAYEPSYMTMPLAASADGRISLAALPELLVASGEATCVACGPGLGRSEDLVQLVGQLWERLERPVVVDADGLNALAAAARGLSAAGGPRIITPHPGEFQRLVACHGESRERMEWRAIELARKTGVVVVLKGQGTLVTDGQRACRNTTGNPGMATGGAGDVLTGLITALVCQGLGPFEAAVLGVYLHGRAGDLAANDLGQVSLIASDLVRYLPRALIAPREHLDRGGNVGPGQMGT